MVCTSILWLKAIRQTIIAQNIFNNSIGDKLTNQITLSYSDINEFKMKINYTPLPTSQPNLFGTIVHNWCLLDFYSQLWFIKNHQVLGLFSVQFIVFILCACAFYLNGIVDIVQYSRLVTSYHDLVTRYPSIVVCKAQVHVISSLIVAIRFLSGLNNLITPNLVYLTTCPNCRPLCLTKYLLEPPMVPCLWYTGTHDTHCLYQVPR